MTIMWAVKISTRTAPGLRFRTTVRYGGQMWQPAGLLIAMAAGCMNLIGDGPGFRPIHGAGLPITMAAGCRTADRGLGGRVRFMDILFTVRFGRRLMFRSLASAAVSDLASASGMAADLGGFHSDRAIISIRGMAGTG